jgi:hypothetical protein
MTDKTTQLQMYNTLAPLSVNHRPRDVGWDLHVRHVSRRVQTSSDPLADPAVKHEGDKDRQIDDFSHLVIFLLIATLVTSVGFNPLLVRQCIHKRLEGEWVRLVTKRLDLGVGDVIVRADRSSG